MNKKTAVYLFKSAICLVALQLLHACAPEPALAGLSPYPHRLAVTPQPQEVWAAEGAAGDFKLNANTSIRVLHDEDVAGAELLASDVERRAGMTLSAQKDAQAPTTSANVIYISRNTDDVKLDLPEAVLARLEVKQAEGYSLVIFGNRALIRAADARGAIYGVQTVRQLLRHDMTLPNLAIRDWPEMPQRMVYGNFNGDFMSKAALDGYVDRAVMLKYNAIVFESVWNAGHNWWFHHAGVRQELARYFQEQCQKYHIEFIPLVQGPGWGYGITDQAPMLTTGEWIQKEKQKLSYAAPTPLAQRNVVTNVSAPIVVTDLESKVEYQKDKDFKVLPGNTVRPYAATNAPWQLQAVEGGAIADGQEVLVSYNAVIKSTSHQAWNISDPEAFSILGNTLDHLQQSMKLSSIHIGHDEIWQLGKDSRDIQSGLTEEQLVHKELMFWYNRIKKNNADANILVWDDLLRPGRSGVSYGILTPSIEKIPKDIVVVPWYYYANPESAATIKNRVEHLTKSGFSVIGAPSGYFRENSYLWYQALQPYLADGRAKGMMFTVWDLLHRGDMVAAGELMWSGQKVDRDLYRAMDALTERMKQQGIVLTLSPKIQMAAFANVVVKGLKEKKTPDQISAEFKAQVIGDTTLYEKTVGAEVWNSLAKNASSPEQELANLQKVPLMIEAMTNYVKADASKDKQLLQSIINSLHELNHTSFAERSELLKKSKAEWLSFQDLFGVAMPAV